MGRSKQAHRKRRHRAPEAHSRETSTTWTASALAHLWRRGAIARLQAGASMGNAVSKGSALPCCRMHVAQMQRLPSLVRSQGLPIPPAAGSPAEDRREQAQRSALGGHQPSCVMQHSFHISSLEGAGSRTAAGSPGSGPGSAGIKTRQGAGGWSGSGGGGRLGRRAKAAAGQAGDHTGAAVGSCDLGVLLCSNEGAPPRLAERAAAGRSRRA